MGNTLDFTKKGCLGPYNYNCVCVYVCVSNVFTFFIPSCDVRYYRNDVRFVFTASWLQEGSYLIDVICVCLRIVVSNTYCFLFDLSSSLLLVCPKLSVSLYCPLSIVPSVFSNIYSIGVSVPSQESEQSCISVLLVSTYPLSVIFLLDVGTIPTVVFYFLNSL